jgi:signal transduction histidine kinase
MGRESYSFKRYYFITSFAVIFMITLGMGSYFVLNKYDELKRQAVRDKTANIENIKKQLKFNVDSFVSLADTIISGIEEDLDRKVKTRAVTAHKIAEKIYNEMAPHHPVSEIRKVVKDALAGMVYGKDYVFVFAADGKIVSSPLLPDIEGVDFMDKQDSEGNYTVRDALKIVQASGEGFQNVYWRKPGVDAAELKRKRVYVKKFEPLEWVIGYGEYYEDFEQAAKQQVISMLDGITVEDSSYLFASTFEGMSLTKPAKNMNMYDVQDANGKYIVRELIRTAKDGGGYVLYVMPPFAGARPENKLSYVAPIPKWGWYVGTGVYLTDVEVAYDKKVAELYASSREDILFVITVLTLLLGGGSLAALHFSGKLQRLIDAYSDEINSKNDELSELNASLEEKVADKTKELSELNQSLEVRVMEEVEKNREKDRIMFQQGRLAAMGEMIGNIAHQWRQPLSSISLLVQDIQEANDYGELTNDYLSQTVSKCTATISHMSDTIDNFRNFFSPDKKQARFRVESEIGRCLSLLDAGLDNNHIEVKLELGETSEIQGVSGEYAQVVVNIINNAKDVLLNRHITNPVIKIASCENDGMVCVTITDNAGGIDADIIDRIFEPYFTTKKDSNGTGIGLYFSKMIVEGNMAGKLTVENADGGACFSICVPKA